MSLSLPSDELLNNDSALMRLCICICLDFGSLLNRYSILGTGGGDGILEESINDVLPVLALTGLDTPFTALSSELFELLLLSK